MFDVHDASRARGSVLLLFEIALLFNCCRFLMHGVARASLPSLSKERVLGSLAAKIGVCGKRAATARASIAIPKSKRVSRLQLEFDLWKSTSRRHGVKARPPGTP